MTTSSRAHRRDSGGAGGALIPRALGFASIAVAAVAACRGDDGTRATGRAEARRVSSGSAGGPSLYDVRAGISICFEQTGPSYDELNTAVQSAIIPEWTAKVGILFTGFAPCAAGPADVHVRFFACQRLDGADCPDGNASPGVRVVGRPSDGQPNVLFLRSDYANHWMRSYCSEAWSLEACTRAYAIHGIGHILGYDHERAAPGSSCDDREVMPGGWVCPGGPDPTSLMSYCSASEDRREWYRRGLNDRDVDCARRFFFDGTPPRRQEACFYDCCEGDTRCEQGQPTPWCFPVGDHPNVGPSLNDRFARVELRGGVTVTAYDDDKFRGESATWHASQGCLEPRLRNNVTSLKVR